MGISPFIQLHRMNESERRWISSELMRSDLQALVLVHPEFYAITPEQIEMVAGGWARTYRGNDISEEDLTAELRANLQRYVDGLRSALADPTVTVRFYFAAIEAPFNLAELLERLRILQALDAVHGTWILIPTDAHSADPLQSTWEVILKEVYLLGLREPLVGGCYCTVDSTGYPVLPSKDLPNHDVNYSCVGHVVREFDDSGLFEPVQLLMQATFFAPPEEEPR